MQYRSSVGIVLIIVACGGQARISSTGDHAPDSCVESIAVCERRARELAELRAAAEADRQREQAAAARRIALVDSHCVVARGNITCTFAALDDCDEFNAKMPKGYEQSCPGLLTRAEIARAEQETNAEHDAALNDARLVLASCQAAVDQGRVDDASSCWRDHSREWSLLDVGDTDVSACLASAAVDLDGLMPCVTAAERTENEIIAKFDCLAAYEATGSKCGPLDLQPLRSERERKLGVAAIKARVSSKAAPIVARREKLKAENDAAQKACIGPNVLPVIMQLQIGKVLDHRRMRHCRYTVPLGGTVLTTTRDGWVVVTWQSLMAAFKTSRRVVDGSMFRASGAAMFTGVHGFDRIDGGMSSLATFVVSE